MRAAALVLLAACAPAGDDTVDTDSDVADTDVVDAGPFLRFVAVDNAFAAKVALVDTRGGGWTVDVAVATPRDIAVVGDEVVVSTQTGFVRLALADGTVRDEVTGFTGVQGARPLDGGHLLLGAQDGADVVFTEVDADGAVVGEPLRLEGYEDLRVTRVLDDGHLLFTTSSGGFRVVEVDRTTGDEVWSAALPGKGYLAEREADGTTLASTGSTVSVVQLDADGAVTRAWGGRERDPELHEQAFFSGFSRIDADHVAVANWHGHELTQGGPHVIVYGADGTRGWTWTPDDVVQCTNVLVLEGARVDEL